MYFYMTKNERRVKNKISRYPDVLLNKPNYNIDSSDLPNFPSVTNFDNSHCEINSVITLSDLLPPKCHNIDINPPITEFKIQVENIDKL